MIQDLLSVKYLLSHEYNQRDEYHAQASKNDTIRERHLLFRLYTVGWFEILLSKVGSCVSCKFDA